MIFIVFSQNLLERWTFRERDFPEGIAVVANINPIAAPTVTWLFISSRWLLALKEDKKGRAFGPAFFDCKSGLDFSATIYPARRTHRQEANAQHCHGRTPIGNTRNTCHGIKTGRAPCSEREDCGLGQRIWSSVNQSCTAAAETAGRTKRSVSDQVQRVLHDDIGG